MDNIFQWLMLLFVIVTSVLRYIKGHKVKKIREQLAAVAPMINASVDPGRRSISGKIDDVPFKIKYEPEVENSPSRLDVILDKKLPFTLEIARRISPFDHQESVQAGEFVLEDRKFDESFCVSTNNTDECREYLKDPLFPARRRISDRSRLLYPLYSSPSGIRDTGYRMVGRLRTGVSFDDQHSAVRAFTRCRIRIVARVRCVEPTLSTHFVASANLVAITNT